MSRIILFIVFELRGEYTEKQYQDGVATGMYWITDASRVLVSEEEYLEHLRMQH